MMSRYTFLGGRRRGSRRREDAGTFFYVDRFGSGLLAVLLLIFFFHILDASFTLAHIARGGSELNPVMDYLIQRSSGLFIGVKLALAAVGLFFLGIHKNFPGVKPAIAVLFLVFAGLLGYHLFLIAS